MKMKFLQIIVLLLFSHHTFAQEIPVIEVRINATASTKDDYVGENFIPCTIRIFNGMNLPDSVPVTLRNIAFAGGGQVVFSKSGSSGPGVEFLNLHVKKDNSSATFYIKGKPGFNSLVDKDAVIEVVDNDPTHNPVVLARKAFMVSPRSPLPNAVPEVEIKINSESTLDDYVTWAPTFCSIRLINHESFSSPVNVTLRNMPASVGKVNFAPGTLANRNTAVDSTLQIALPPSGSWVNFYIAGRFNHPSKKDKDAVIEVFTKAGKGQNVTVSDTVIKEVSLPVVVRDTVRSIDTVLSKISVRDTVISGTDTLVSLRDTVKTVVGTLITVRTNYVAGRDTVISTRDTLLAGIDTVLAREPLMVRIRKNGNTLTAAERDAFLNALVTLNNTFNGYKVFNDIHARPGAAEMHGGPGFLPWHRAFVLNLERKLQSVDPSVTVPYWKFDEPAPNILSPDFMGSKPKAAGDNYADFTPNNPLNAWNVPDGPGIRRVTSFEDNGVPSQSGTRNEVATLALGTTYGNFRGMETNPHGDIHRSSGQTGDWLINTSVATRDPLFFLLHGNIDRLWAKWQSVNNRFDLNTSSYNLTGSFEQASNPAAHIGHYPLDTMWPWNGITGTFTGSGSVRKDERPTTAPGGPFPSAISFDNAPVPAPQPYHMIDYKNNRLLSTPNSGLGFSYDDVPF